MATALPVIGIPCATYARPFPYPLAHGNNETYLRAVEHAGGAPVLIPLVESETTLRRLFEQIDGLLLAGGADVEPQHYGQQPHPKLGKVNAEQDRVELLLSRWAREVQMPVFAICRGFQLINVAYGGTLYQDLPDLYPVTHNHDESFELKERDRFVHDLRLAEESRLRAILELAQFPVNSMHHQAIDQLAPPLRATGWSNDGLVEAFEATDEHWLVGVQCHPEELVKGVDRRWERVFSAFIAAAHTWRTTMVQQ